MQSLRRHRFALNPIRVAAVAALALTPHVTGWTADIDIYGPTATGTVPNVVFLLDNTSNWSANNQAWSKSSVDAKCNAMTNATEKATCLGYSNQIFLGASSLKQGQVQLRALKLVLNELVCHTGASALRVSVGLSLMDQQSTLSNGHGVGLINFAVQPLTGTASTAGSSCKAIIDRLDTIDGWVQDPQYKAASNANYGAPLYEIFKYFGGHSNPALAANPDPNGGSPVGATGYGPIRYSKPNVLDDAAAFADAAKTTYQSPITPASACGGNYVVLVGNTYPDFEPSNGDPTVFKGIGYTPPLLDAIESDVSRYADEWTDFLANTDVSPLPGVQRVFTYAIDTYNDKPDAAQGKLLLNMAREGGIGPSAYYKVGGDISALINGFKDILANIAAVNSVFTATTLPVSTTTQGTFLNQIFVGMFRPDANFSPRWVGNLKQYELGFVGGKLDLVGKDGKSAVAGGTGFFNATAQSFWTKDSVFFAQKPSGSPPSASDWPDGPIVEKGGAAQQLREVYLQGASARKVKTLDGSGAWDDFTTGSSGLSEAVVKWARGENNVDPITDPAGAEEFNGSYLDGTVTKLLPTTGARHSIHGDVLHSRPVALNYGGDDNVVVYYGSNDGFLHAVDGSKTKSTGGQELWSFISRDHYPLLERLRSGTQKLHLPETNASGGTITAPTGSAAKSYGMDGPIGVYARYNSSGEISGTGAEAWIFPTMRRGGRSVYAFNVTNPAAPAFKWKITGGAGGDFDKLGQTWSMPKAVVFKETGTPKPPILIMGGGYDPKEDVNGSDGIGKYIYIINGNTGTLIKALETDYSVPSDVTIVDVDGNGDPDRAYVADVRGNLYRVDIPTSGDRTDPGTWSGVSAVKIAALASHVSNKVFFPPDVVVTKNFVAVMVGTGDREKPLMTSTSDRFFLVKDKVGDPRASALTIGDLAEVAIVNSSTMQPAAPAGPAASKANGCYISLATNGEKVVNAPFTIAGATYFGTNRPKPASSTSCSGDLGEAYAYKFPLFCTVPQPPSRVEGGGLLPSPVGGIVTIKVNGVDTKVPFLIGGGEGGSAFKPEEPKPPVPPRRTRQNWRIDNTNR